MGPTARWRQEGPTGAVEFCPHVPFCGWEVVHQVGTLSKATVFFLCYGGLRPARGLGTGRCATRADWRCCTTCGVASRRPGGRPGCGRAHMGGRYLVRQRDLVGAPRGRTGLLFCLPGRGEHLPGGTTHAQLRTNWGGRGRPAGHAAVPPAVPRWPPPPSLAGPRGCFLFCFQGWIPWARSSRPLGSAGPGPA
jgi:hypothetical protein